MLKINKKEFKKLTGYSFEELNNDYFKKIKPASFNEFGVDVFHLSLNDLSLIFERVKELTKEEVELDIVSNSTESF